MLEIKPKQLSLYSTLYNRIPQSHILVKINETVDFSFVNELLEGSYCKYYGRPAKEPELMIRICILQHFYDLSDERIMAETDIILAYKYFVGLNPEDDMQIKVCLQNLENKD